MPVDIKTYYFPDILRKVNLAMLNLFGGIKIAKRDVNKTLIEYREVPIRFVHKQKFIPLLTDNQEANKMWFNQHLPQIALFISGISYNADKARGGYDSPIYSYVDANDATKKIFSGTPYKITYTIGILSMHMTEMSMILEQILPEFNPYHNITIREWDFLPELTRDLKVLLEGPVQTNFDDEIPEERFKKIEFELNFSVDCNFYMPVQTADIIKHVQIDLSDYDTEKINSTFNYGVSGNDATNFVVTANAWTEFVD